MYLTTTRTATAAALPTVSEKNGDVWLTAAVVSGGRSDKSIVTMTPAEAAEVGRQLLRAAGRPKEAPLAVEELARAKAELAQYSMTAATADLYRRVARAATTSLGLDDGCDPRLVADVITGILIAAGMKAPTPPQARLTTDPLTTVTGGDPR